MIVIDKNFYPKKEALKRCEDFMKNSTVFFSDGSFTAGKNEGGYGFISLGKVNARESGVAPAKTPVEMELQAIKHTLIYLNFNKDKMDDTKIVIFNDCLNAISKIKQYTENPNKPESLLDEIYALLKALSDKDLLICWLKKESLKYHEQVDSLSKVARTVER